jgi:hypothetical protein
MIVRHGNGRIYLITQPDHASLARRITEHWDPVGDAERRALSAAAHPTHRCDAYSTRTVARIHGWMQH